MGKTLLRHHLRRNKPRHPRCQRFCSCCREGSPIRRLTPKKKLQKKKDPRKCDHVKAPKKRVVSVSPLWDHNPNFSTLRNQLKKVSVRITRLSEAVLNVLSENGSIGAGVVVTELISLSPVPKLGNVSCLGTPSRRLRSTPVQPVVRLDVLDRMRELNADWRSATYSSGSCQEADYIRKFDLTLKTLFLENLSICQKSPVADIDEKNGKMSQDENRPNFMNLIAPRSNDVSKNLSVETPSSSKVSYNSYPKFVGTAASRCPIPFSFIKDTIAISSPRNYMPITNYRSLLASSSPSRLSAPIPKAESRHPKLCPSRSAKRTNLECDKNMETGLIESLYSSAKKRKVNETRNSLRGNKQVDAKKNTPVFTIVLSDSSDGECVGENATVKSNANAFVKRTATKVQDATVDKGIVKKASVSGTCTPIRKSVRERKATYKALCLKRMRSTPRSNRKVVVKNPKIRNIVKNGPMSRKPIVEDVSSDSEDGTPKSTNRARRSTGAGRRISPGCKLDAPQTRQPVRKRKSEPKPRNSSCALEDDSDVEVINVIDKSVGSFHATSLTTDNVVCLEDDVVESSGPKGDILDTLRQPGKIIEMCKKQTVAGEAQPDVAFAGPRSQKEPSGMNVVVINDDVETSVNASESILKVPHEVHFANVEPSGKIAENVPQLTDTFPLTLDDSSALAKYDSHECTESSCSPPLCVGLPAEETDDLVAAAGESHEGSNHLPGSEHPEEGYSVSHDALSSETVSGKFACSSDLSEAPTNRPLSSGAGDTCSEHVCRVDVRSSPSRNTPLFNPTVDLTSCEEALHGSHDVPLCDVFVPTLGTPSAQMGTDEVDQSGCEKDPAAPKECTTDPKHTEELGSDVVEILMLECCPSCQNKVIEGPSSPRAIDWNQCNQNDASVKDNQDVTKNKCSKGGCKAQEGNFYFAISNLLRKCLNNFVGAVKLDSREVIIKKVNPQSSKNDLKMESQAVLGAKDLASIVQELNLQVPLNPRLTIKKLPYTPQDGVLHESPNVCKSADFPQSGDASLPSTPTKSFHAGFPTPIKRLNPRVLTVVKYNDLEIHNDEPSLNDPPESDRLECVTSNGVRFELNPEELADVENLLNDFKDRGNQTGDAIGIGFEIDDLVINNDEPPLNPVATRSVKYPRLLFENEDLDDLVIDNDDPPLNEPIPCEPSLNDDCLVISSDDEVPEVIHILSEPEEQVGKHRMIFRKKRCSRRPLAVSRGDGLQSKTTDCEDVDVSNLMDVDESNKDDSGVALLRQPLPPFQTCREVLHQPQVFNNHGQPLFAINNKVRPSNASTYGPLAIGRSRTIEPESLNISDSDTLTASESDGAEFLSPIKPAGNNTTYRNICDIKSVVQSVDTDSDDDVIMVPSSDNPVTSRFHRFPTPIPSLATRLDLARRRGVSQEVERIQMNLPPQLSSSKISAIRSRDGNSYYVLVVPPKPPVIPHTFPFRR